MSEPLTKRLNNNFSSKRYSVKSQITCNNKSKEIKLLKNTKTNSKNKPTINKGNTKIKVKRRIYKIINSRNDNKTSENHTQNNNYAFIIKDNNNNNDEKNEDKINKEININKEKYTKDSDIDFYPKAFYINNYNNNYINISNITIENNNNEKEKNQEKDNKNKKNEEIKKSFSDKNLLNKKSLKEDIIISDDQKINNDKDLSLDKSLDFYSGEKGSNLSCLLSYSKNRNYGFGSFYSKSKKYMHKNHLDSINNFENRKKEKGKKKMINISLNYRNRNDVHNIYSNNKFYTKNNKTFFRESKSVKNFLLDLRKNKFIKEKHEKLNNSVTFRKTKKIKYKDKETTIRTDSIKKIFKVKNVIKLNENKNCVLTKNSSLKKNNNKIETNQRDLTHSNTKKNYYNNKNENFQKKKNKDIKKNNNNLEKDNEDKKKTKYLKSNEKINYIKKLFKNKKTIKPNKSNNKNIKSKDTSKSKSKTKSKKINENTNKISTPLSLTNSSHSKKPKLKEYPNMVQKEELNNFSFENYTKKIKNINVICKVGDSGTFQKKLNQDNYFIMNNFLGNSDYTFLGVCDGHGIYGQNISSYLKEHLPMNIQEELIDKNILDLSNIDITFLSEIIESTYKLTNNQMNSDERIDSSLSGSTCIAGLYTPSQFFCINVGDSRCVLFKYFQSKNSWTFSNLSRDHKPSDISEKTRIIESGGKVESYINEKGQHVGPERVWITEMEDRVAVPGLAMSRSFGDQIAHSVGVVVSPEILEHHFCEEDKVILLASDGIWEFLESEEILDMIKKYYEKNDAEGALEEIYKEADKRWRENEGIVDDITAIIIFLE